MTLFGKKSVSSSVSWTAYAVGILLFASTGTAHAAGSLPSTLGEMLNNIGSDIYRTIPVTIILGCYVFSFWLAADTLTILYKEAKAGGDMGRHGNPWVRFAVAGFFAALPSTLDMGIASVFGSAPSAITGGSVSAPQECLVGTSSESAALTCVARNIGVNVVPIGIKIIFMFMYLGGMMMFCRALYTMAKHSRSGGHDRNGPAKQVSLIGISVLMMMMPTLMNTIATTLGYGDATVLAGNRIGLGNTVPSILAYSGDGNSNSDLTKFHELISWCFVILSLAGVWVVSIGLNKLRLCAEGGGGGQNENMRAALTHLIGGTMMINGKLAMCLVVSTFVGKGHGFC